MKSDWAPALLGVPQVTILGPLLFSLCMYLNGRYLKVGLARKCHNHTADQSTHCEEEMQNINSHMT